VSNIEKFIDFAIVLVWFRLIRVGVLVVDFSSGSFIFLLSNPDKPELKIEDLKLNIQSIQNQKIRIAVTPEFLLVLKGAHDESRRNDE
jgi:hypothetical protein